MDEQAYMEYAFGCNEDESNSWVQPSIYLPSNDHESQLKNSVKDISTLPDLALQPSISSELELLNDSDTQEATQGENKARGDGKDCDQFKQNLQDEEVAQYHFDSNPRCLRSSKAHNVSERRRRGRINGKLKQLQELLPHCHKKDKSTILDEAAKYIKTLKHQVETMTKPGGVHFIAPSMPPYPSNNSVQFRGMCPFVPIRPAKAMGFGMPLESEMCYSYTAPCSPFVQHPSTGAAFFNTGFPFPLMPPIMPIQPVARSSSDASKPHHESFMASPSREQPSDPSTAAASDQATISSYSSGVEAGDRYFSEEEYGTMDVS